MDVQDLSSFLDVSACSSKSLRYCFSLDFLEGQERGYLVGNLAGFTVAGMTWEVFARDFDAGAEKHGAFDHTLELPNIAGPVVFGEGGDRFMRDAGDLLFVLISIDFQEMAGQQRQVVQALPERRNLNLYGAYSKVEILSKQSFFHGLACVSVIGGYLS